MSNFRKGQGIANPARVNAILSTLIVVLILNITLQIWLLYAALNNALDDNTEILIPAFLASLTIFLIGFGWLYYLPGGPRRREKQGTQK
jgi:uncharacterized BrkB/YihY/UPF0761 family membrane protein